MVDIKQNIGSGTDIALLLLVYYLFTEGKPICRLYILVIVNHLSNISRLGEDLRIPEERLPPTPIYIRSIRHRFRSIVSLGTTFLYHFDVSPVNWRGQERNDDGLIHQSGECFEVSRRISCCTPIRIANPYLKQVHSLSTRENCTKEENRCQGLCINITTPHILLYHIFVRLSMLVQ